MALTIKHAGSDSTAVTSTMQSPSGGRIVRVVPTVILGTTHDNDVMFDTVEIEDAVDSPGGISRLVGIYVLDVDNENHDMDMVFMGKNSSLGTTGSAPSISDADAKAANICGVISLDFTDRQVSIGGATVTGFSNGSGQTVANMPMLVQAEPGSTSIFLGAIAREEMAFGSSTADLQIILHFEYLKWR
tara:strand:- start:41 stop:604 length:564 start_codon:yes stop_codon:yes gene_type:complete